jgi:hypothetical protein
MTSLCNASKNTTRKIIFASALSLAFFACCGVSYAQQEPANPTRLPQVNVTDQLKEEAPTGAFGAPDWTTDRRFSTTRVYLQQGPGDVGFEQWWRGRFYRDGTVQNRFQEEVEIGLPFRFQLDLYETWVADQDRHTTQDEASIELRWALADWGKIPLNPTLYCEYAFVNGDADTVETKLLLGENIARRWHWGMNFSCEQEVTGAHSTELLAAQGISYTVVDKKLDVGLEMEFIDTTEQGSRGSPSVEFQIGPSIQWRPTEWSHLDVVPLLGTTGNSPRVEGFIIFGIDFGPGKCGGHNPAAYTPAALGGH